VRFLTEVAAERQHQVRFEDLVKEPERVLRGICDFLGLEYEDAMAAPYQQQEQKMVDGIHPLSKMLGDVKFHEHKGVTAATAERWRQEVGADDELADETWAMAQRLGYSRPQASSREWSPLVQLRTGDERRPLFFVHPVGGNVFCYAELVRHLQVEQSFYGLQSFGLSQGQSPLTDIPQMAQRYLEAIRAVQAEGPYMLGGWSMGGLIAFEMAQQLHNAGQQVSLLALLDTHTANVLDQAANSHDQFTADLAQLNGSGETGLDADQRNRLYEVFRANVDALMRYQPKRYPGRITFFRPNTRLTENGYDPINDWRELAEDGVEVHVVPGDHYTILKEPLIAELLATKMRKNH
jgi:thioesterase domain-containing protein